MAVQTINDWLRYGPEYVENFGSTDRSLRLDQYNNNETWTTVGTKTIPANTKYYTNVLDDGIYRWRVPNVDNAQTDEDYDFHIYPVYPKLTNYIAKYKNVIDEKFMILLFLYLSKTSEIMESLAVPSLVPDLEVVSGYKEILDSLLEMGKKFESYCKKYPEICNTPINIL